MTAIAPPPEKQVSENLFSKTSHRKIESCIMDRRRLTEFEPSNIVVVIIVSSPIVTEPVRATRTEPGLRVPRSSLPYISTHGHPDLELGGDRDREPWNIVLPGTLSPSRLGLSFRVSPRAVPVRFKRRPNPGPWRIPWPWLHRRHGTVTESLEKLLPVKPLAVQSRSQDCHAGWATVERLRVATCFQVPLWSFDWRLSDDNLPMNGPGAGGSRSKWWINIIVT